MDFRFKSKKEYEDAIASLMKNETEKLASHHNFEDDYDDLLEEYLRFLEEETSV